MKRKYKILLDIIMLLMTLTLFSKQFFGMKYHEIAGLVLVGIIFVHICINIKMVSAMCKNFIKIPIGLKTGLIVDILLLICFLWLGLSGVLISHTIFTGITTSNSFFKLSHMFAGGASVILLGIHIGLHICRSSMPLKIAVIITVAALCAGGFGAVNCDIGRWLSIPVTSVLQQDRNESFSGQSRFKNNNNPKNQNSGRNEKGGKNENGGRNIQSLSVSQKAENVIMFSGMIAACAMITYWIFGKRNKIPCRKEIENDLKN